MNYKTCATVAVLVAVAAARANLIENGSFESNTYTQPFGGFFTLGPPDNALTDWTISYGSIDVIKSYWQPADGSYSIDMAGGSASQITQTVNGLVKGKAYTIYFDLSGNPDGPPQQKTLQVDAAGSAASSYNYTIGTNTHSDMAWQKDSYTFTAASTSELISFTSLNPPVGNGSTPYGPALDNISMSTPSPAAVLPFAFGVVPLIRMRRKAK